MKTPKTYDTLVGLIEQFRKGYGSCMTALDYYIDYCDSKKIHIIPDEFCKMVVGGTDDELYDWLTINVKNAVSYYD